MMDQSPDFAALRRALPARKAAARREHPAPYREMQERTRMAPEAPAPRLNGVVAERGVEPTTEALKAWHARVNGVPIIDVAHAMGIPLALAKKLIGEVHEAIHEDLKENLNLNRQLDLQRIDGIIHTFYPLAREGDVEGANVTLRALQQRSKLTGIEPLPDPGRSHPESVLVWINNQLPSINKIVDSLPLELPPGAP